MNNCKAWHQADAMVVMAAEEDEEEKEKTKLSGRKLTAEQVKMLTAVLNRYRDILSDKPGKIEGVAHEINTGDAPPCRTMPYRLCPAYREAVKDEVRKLLDGGMIEPSTSPWSSPMVPVKKPDGSIRLCIDFRKLNSVTVPDPYCMPMVDDLLDQVGDCEYLSKIDLTKGRSLYSLGIEIRQHFAHHGESSGSLGCLLD